MRKLKLKRRHCISFPNKTFSYKNIPKTIQPISGTFLTGNVPLVFYFNFVKSKIIKKLGRKFATHIIININGFIGHEALPPNYKSRASQRFVLAGGTPVRDP